VLVVGCGGGGGGGVGGGVMKMNQLYCLSFGKQ